MAVISIEIMEDEIDDVLDALAEIMPLCTDVMDRIIRETVSVVDKEE